MRGGIILQQSDAFFTECFCDQDGAGYQMSQHREGPQIAPQMAAGA